MDIFAAIFAGLGLFFIGIKQIGGNLKQMGGRRFRQVMAKATGSPRAAAALGIAAGALTQSTNAVTFISINVVTAGLVTGRQVLPVLIWANVGTSALVLLAAIDIHLLVLFLVGAVGMMHYLDIDKSARFRHLVGALLGIGLLFLGLELIRSGAATLRDIDSVRSAVAVAGGSYPLVFLAGVAIAAIAQSSATVTMIAIAMAVAGLFDFAISFMIVCGAGVGSGLAVWAMAAKLKGTPKQLAMLQTFTKCAGALVLVPVFALELFGGAPLIDRLLEAITTAVHEKIALLYLLYQIVSALVVSALLGPVFTALRRLYPETPDESLSKPRFIYEGGDLEAETALLLVEREQERLLGYLSESLDWVREDAAGDRKAMNRPRLLLEASHSVGGEIGNFLAQLMDSAPPRETMERLTAMNTAQYLLGDLAGEVHRLVDELDSSRAPDTLAPAYAGMVESLHLIVSLLVSELQARDAFQRETLLVMTADRSDMMDEMRRTLMRRDRALSKAEQEQLFSLTAAFEHSVWLIRRYVTLLAPPTDEMELKVPGEDPVLA